MAITIERAAEQAIAKWIASQLLDCQVSERWPDQTVDLPQRAITIVRSGPPIEELLEPRVTATKLVHDNITPRIATAAATDQATANALLNAAKASWNMHLADVVAHLAADTADAVTTPDATDLATSLALATGLLAALSAHPPSATYHATPDTTSIAITAPTTLPEVILAANAIAAAVNKHFAIALYTWQIASADLPLQLDVWTRYDAEREDVMARLRGALNASPGATAGVVRADPVQNGLLLAFDPAGGFAGFIDAQFDRPLVIDTSDAITRSEYRANYRGTASYIVTLDVLGPRLVTIAMQMATSESDPSTANAPSNTITLSYAKNADGYTLQIQ